MKLSLKSYAENLRDELDDFAETLRHQVTYCETDSNYVFRVQFIPCGDPCVIPQMEVEHNELKVFADAPDRVKAFICNHMRAKTFYEPECFWLIRGKAGSAEEIIAWHDAGLVINQILAVRNKR